MSKSDVMFGKFRIIHVMYDVVPSFAKKDDSRSDIKMACRNTSLVKYLRVFQKSEIDSEIVSTSLPNATYLIFYHEDSSYCMLIVAPLRVTEIVFINRTKQGRQRKEPRPLKRKARMKSSHYEKRWKQRMGRLMRWWKICSPRISA